MENLDAPGDAHRVSHECRDAAHGSSVAPPMASPTSPVAGSRHSRSSASLCSLVLLKPCPGRCALSTLRRAHTACPSPRGPPHPVLMHMAPDTAEVKWLQVVACSHPGPACSGIPRHLFLPCLSRLRGPHSIAVLGDAGDREEPSWLSIWSCSEQVPGAQEPPSRPANLSCLPRERQDPTAIVHPSSW